MKKVSTLMAVLALTFLFIGSVNAQNLLTEDFSYPAGDLITAHGWTAHSGTLGPITVTSPGLTYTNYAGSGVGNAVSVTTAGSQDVNTLLSSPVTTGTVYASAMINVTNAPSIVGDYVFHLGNGTTAFTGKSFVRKNGTGIDFGVSKLGNATTTTAAVPVWTSTVNPSGYAINTTHLVVIKYTINPGATDDQVDLFVDPTVNAAEPSATITTTDGGLGTDVASIAQVYIRQGSAGQIPDAIIDGVRVALTWADLPLPVELSSFTSKMNGRNIQLNWETKTELNFNKFEIDRALVSTKDASVTWASVGIVQASGSSNSPKKYSYTEKNLQAGKYQYRLKMIDNDGAYKYSNVVETEISIPKNFELSQNYPNPFNPSTRINYSLPFDSRVTLEVYNIAGVKMGQIVNEEQSAGYYTVNFSSSTLNRSIASGVYIYKINAIDKSTGNVFSSIKKMMLLK